ncbi:isochorismatase family protein [Alcaligenes sp. SDU_A2]|uniref:isochorismatase family protein n=1 Tax=Alcaligenes sp. SDU_A2 TaxID=3136634 RepID=UPI00311D4856
MPVLTAHQSLVLIVDMQTGLLPAIADHAALLDRAGKLAQAARLLGVPVFATEHWADKIGPTDRSLTPHLDQVLHKKHFDATREVDFLPALPVGRPRVLLLGTEAHICVLQTGLGLKERGYEPVLVGDCVGSRRHEDRQAAWDRWAQHGLERVSAEMAMFEWLEIPSNPAFRQVLALVK